MRMKFLLLLAAALLHLGTCDTNATNLYGVAGGFEAGNSVVLSCVVHADATFRSWQRRLLNSEPLLAANDVFASQRYNRSKNYSLSLTGAYYNFTMNPVSMYDEGEYVCAMYGMETTHQIFHLEVNKIPDISVEALPTTVKEGDPTAVASCTAANSKPEAQIWFEDQDGVRVESLEAAVTTNSTSGTSLLYSSTRKLALTWNSSMNGNSYSCVVKHENVEHEMKLDMDAPVNVQYKPTVGLTGVAPDGELMLVEESELSVECITTGNPQPSITWTYLSKEPVLVNNATTSELPENFHQEGGYLRSSSLLTGGLNNGTFVCKIGTGGIFEVISASFSLSVFDKPTTTPAPTTTVEAQTTVISFVEPQQGSISSTTIAIIVAIICFIIIVAAIAFARVFITRKGEYYTNELKSGANTENGELDADESDRDSDVLTEADLLGDKARKTEHFV